MTSKAAIHVLMWSFPLGGVLLSPAQAADPRALPANTPAVVTVAPSPFDLNVTYTGEVWRNAGGLKTAVDYMSGIDLNLTVDAQRLLGVPNAKFYLEGFYVGGKSLNTTYTGAIQGPSALDAYGAMNKVKFYQAYYEQQFGNTDVLVGKFDTQTQFATTRPMELFGNKGQAMNMAFILMGGASGFNGPSTYPDTAIGLRVKHSFNDQWTVKAAILDGEADLRNNATGILIKDDYGALGIGEVDYTPWAYTKLMAGVWGDTGRFDKLAQFTGAGAPIQTRGTMGEYVGGTTRLYTIEGARGVDTFFNVGFADAATSIFSHSYSAGMTITGLFDFRPTDKLGVAVALGENSRGFRNLLGLQGWNITRYETAYELTYRAKITDWLVLQPEFEYIEHPAGGGQANGSGLKNALVFGLHFELHKEFF